VPVHQVADMTLAGNSIERELAMVKVKGKGEHRVEALRMADLIGARVVDVTLESFVFELARTTQEIDEFVDLMRPLGLAEVTRTGVCAMLRGADGFRLHEPQPEPPARRAQTKKKPAKAAPAR
jgi:acetolactate synthase-1/3 small subunit